MDPDAMVDETTASKAIEECIEKYIHVNIMLDPPPYYKGSQECKIYILDSVSIMARTRLLAIVNSRVGLAVSSSIVGNEIYTFTGGKYHI